jgi:hypothetical protein
MGGVKFLVSTCSPEVMYKVVRRQHTPGKAQLDDVDEHAWSHTPKLLPLVTLLFGI